MSQKTSPMDGPMRPKTLIVDLWTSPEDWPDAVKRLGIQVGDVECQPIADQIMLRRCSGVPAALPAWLRVVTQ